MSKYENIKPIANCYFNGEISINIYEIQYGIDDYIIAGFSDGTQTRKRKIKYNQLGGYFNINKIRIYLSDCKRL